MRKTVLFRGIQVLRGVRMKKTYLFMLVLLFAPLAARAAGGGACPSDAQYVNPTNPTGPLVTLSSIGITSCFYFADSGLDTNAGTTEAAPFLHAPFMPNCASSCAAAQAAFGPGEGIIARGGDTWHYFSGTPLIGLPSGWPTGKNGYAWHMTVSGTSANPVYIGVDKNWFSGSAWTRPVITTDNPIFTPSAPAFSNPASTSVSRCAFPQGNLDDFAVTGPTFWIFDNFEFTGMCWNDRTDGGTGSNEHNMIKQFQGGGTGSSPRYIFNTYTHGWSHTSFADCASSGACNGPSAFLGSTQAIDSGLVLAFNVVDGSDSDDFSFSFGFGDGYDVEENVFRHLGGTQIFDNCHSVHDNLFEYINNGNDNMTHGDMFFCESDVQPTQNNFFYNNLVRYIATEYNQDALSAVWWLTPSPGKADYFYNNVGHDVNCDGDCNNMGQSGQSNSSSQILIYNNTWQSVPVNGQNFKIFGNTSFPGAITSQNNHWITNGGTGCGNIFTGTANVNGGNTACSGDVFQTIAAANAQGYTSANDYAPTAASTATAGKVENETGIAGTFGLAFLQSTSNGCAYNPAGHTVTCPAITVSNRPSIGNWDAGAYVSGSSDQPPAPANLAATVNN